MLHSSRAVSVVMVTAYKIYHGQIVDQLLDHAIWFERSLTHSVTYHV
jgi:hypothetical protein